MLRMLRAIRKTYEELCSRTFESTVAREWVNVI
jgi:hypothetical protein